MSRISSSHFPLNAVFDRREAGGVAARVRQTFDEARADRIGGQREHDRHCAGQLEQRPRDRAAAGQDDVRRERKQLRRVLANALGIARPPARVDAHVAGDGPARLPQPLHEHAHARLSFRVVRGRGHEHADAPRPALLRARRVRVRGCCAAEQR